ncbi:lipopolysaccharide biosynthesis protein [Halomarina litorea]|uniref:lipopolysaccharide biosynthesis protein n=1 Tax=Halomarina litorea TaxID=2961595 RepID=UPI0020C494F2|nr:lipopolysaccharide biosynthesis protein [Halomarina sp. BCD28]
MGLRQLIRRVREMLSSGSDGSITGRVVKSGMWVSVLQVSDRLLQLVLLVVLARLLDPTAFGVFGIAMLALGALRKFSDLGLNASLIYDRDENIDHLLDTAWILEIARTAVLGVGLFLAAGTIARVFGEPSAEPLIQVIGLSRLFIGMRNPAVIYFQKDLQFHKQFVYIFSGSVIHFVAGIGYALFVAADAWALVIGYVLADAFRFFASYVLHDYRPSFSFDMDAARSMIGYGKWITATSILYFFYSEGDDALVGAFLGSTALGLYRYAYQLSNAPATEVTHVISSVMFPAYSKLQDDLSMLREGFHRTLQVTTLISFPLAMGIVAVTPPFVRGFLGSQWEPVILTMQILALFGLMRSAAATFGPVWKATGQPDLIAKFSLVRVICLALTIPPVVLFYQGGGQLLGLRGIEVVALIIIGVQVFPMFPIDIYYLRKTIDTTYSRMARDLSYPLAASLAMYAVVVAVRELLAFGPVVEFGILVVVGGIAYVAAVFVLDRGFGWGLERNIRKALSSVAG